MHNIRNVLNTTEFFTLKWLFLCYAKFTSKLFSQKKAAYVISHFCKKKIRIPLHPHRGGKAGRAALIYKCANGGHVQVAQGDTSPVLEPGSEWLSHFLDV